MGLFFETVLKQQKSLLSNNSFSANVNIIFLLKTGSLYNAVQGI